MAKFRFTELNFSQTCGHGKPQFGIA
jgi:hypothetical protein